MNFESNALLVAFGLFAAILLAQDVGRRLGRRSLAQSEQGDGSGTGVIDGAVFALLGLLIAFTFSGAAGRFDDRRKLIVEEVNAVGTAYLRLDLLPAASQPPMRDRFRRYLDARLAAYAALPDMAAAQRQLAVAGQVQSEIWASAIESTAGLQPATMLLLPALNDMFDIATTRTVTATFHPPVVIFILLVVIALLGALLAGFAAAPARRRNWVHSMVFAATLAGAIYVILDIEYPRLGFIRVDRFDAPLIELRQSMG